MYFTGLAPGRGSPHSRNPSATALLGAYAPSCPAVRAPELCWRPTPLAAPASETENTRLRPYRRGAAHQCFSSLQTPIRPQA